MSSTKGVSPVRMPAEVPALKCGPGRSERSHRPDEYALCAEVVEGARFYERLVLGLAALRQSLPGTRAT